MRVPPGYPADSFNLGLTSGEYYKVLSKQDIAKHGAPASSEAQSFSDASSAGSSNSGGTGSSNVVSALEKGNAERERQVEVLAEILRGQRRVQDEISRVAESIGRLERFGT